MELSDIIEIKASLLKFQNSPSKGTVLERESYVRGTYPNVGLKAQVQYIGLAMRPHTPNVELGSKEIS